MTPEWLCLRELSVRIEGGRAVHIGADTWNVTTGRVEDGRACSVADARAEAIGIARTSPWTVWSVEKGEEGFYRASASGDRTAALRAMAMDMAWGEIAYRSLGTPTRFSERRPRETAWSRAAKILGPLSGSDRYQITRAWGEELRRFRDLKLTFAPGLDWSPEVG